MKDVAAIIEAVEKIAPPRLAVDGDPIGLHYGMPGKPVRRVAMALDASLTAMEMAAKMKADMLLVHHPRFWGGLKDLRENRPAGMRAVEVVRRDMAVYSAHTNLDAAPGGTNDVLAETVGLLDADIVETVRTEKLVKLAVFVPASHVEKVRKAVCGAGAGAIGGYADCTFRCRGVGTFSCGEGTRPYQGRPGSFEEADEFRLETVCNEWDVDGVVAAMLAAHPYEEAAYDLYPLLREGRRHGLGRVGRLPGKERIADVAARLAAASGSKMTQYSGSGSRRVERVAVWAGAGVNAPAIKAGGAELLVAGEVGYHDVETLRDYGIEVITLGHGHSEELVLKPWAARMRALVRGVGFRVLPGGIISMTNV